jgi:SAM-dependent methyltransferase
MHLPPSPPTDHPAEYDPFAWIYERDWGHEYHEQALDVLRRALLDELPPPAHLLDLCCGNGRLTAELCKLGYRVTGIDASAEMLAYARARAPQADLLLADARSFRLPPEFDAAISTFDSLNHITVTPQLAEVFANTFACLRPGGRFVFDLNDESAYTNLWIWPFTKVEDDRAFVARGAYDKHSRVAQCDVTVFRRAPDNLPNWVRSDFRLLQTFHPAADVLRMLTQSGFASVAQREAQRDFGMLGGIGYGRSYFFGRRPAAGNLF